MGYSCRYEQPTANVHNNLGETPFIMEKNVCADGVAGRRITPCCYAYMAKTETLFRNIIVINILFIANINSILLLQRA